MLESGYMIHKHLDTIVVTNIKSVKEKIKEDVLYKLENGELIQV